MPFGGIYTRTYKKLLPESVRSLLPPAPPGRSPVALILPTNRTPPSRVEGPCMLPTFLCLGGQRCGTTWLHEALKRCPHVHVSADKETDYFNRKILADDLASYERQFDAPAGVTVRGEVSPNYCTLKRPAIELIRRLYPRLRLVLILRNPADRSASQAWLDLCHMRGRPGRGVAAWEYLLHAERQ